MSTKRQEPLGSKKSRMRPLKQGRKQIAMEAVGDVRALPAFSLRSTAILLAAKTAGYLRGEKSERVGGRVSPHLLSAAKDKSGIESQTELLEYALSKVALEDDYGPKLLARKGRVSEDVEL